GVAGLRLGPRRGRSAATGAVGALVAAGALSAGVGGLQHGGFWPGGAHRAFDTLGWAGWWSRPGATLRQVFAPTPPPPVARAGGGGLQHGGFGPGGGPRAFGTLGLAGWWSPPGATLRQVFALTPTPTVAQAGVWVTALVAAAAVTAWRTRSARRSATRRR